MVGFQPLIFRFPLAGVAAIDGNSRADASLMCVTIDDQICVTEVGVLLWCMATQPAWQGVPSHRAVTARRRESLVNRG